MSHKFENEKIDIKVAMKVRDEQAEKLSRLLLDWKFLTTIGTNTEGRERLNEIEVDINITKHFILYLDKLLME